VPLSTSPALVTIYYTIYSNLEIGGKIKLLLDNTIKKKKKWKGT
jgi:hypothetical protein